MDSVLGTEGRVLVEGDFNGRGLNGGEFGKRPSIHRVGRVVDAHLSVYTGALIVRGTSRR